MEIFLKGITNGVKPTVDADWEEFARWVYHIASSGYERAQSGTKIKNRKWIEKKTEEY